MSHRDTTQRRARPDARRPAMLRQPGAHGAARGGRGTGPGRALPAAAGDVPGTGADGALLPRAAGPGPGRAVPANRHWPGREPSARSTRRGDPVPAGRDQLCSSAELHAQRRFAAQPCSAGAHARPGLRGHRPGRARVADPQWEIKVLLRVSDVLDRCGDHDDAVELQSRAMRLMYGDAATPEAPTTRTMVTCCRTTRA